MKNLPEPVDKELFRDVVLAVGVLECQVELVVLVEHGEAVLGVGPGTPLCAAGAVDVHLDVLLQLLGVLEPAVTGAAVGHEPSHACKPARRERKLFKGSVDEFTCSVIVRASVLLTPCCYCGELVGDLGLLANLGRSV